MLHTTVKFGSVFIYIFFIIEALGGAIQLPFLYKSVKMILLIAISFTGGLKLKVK